MSALAEVDRAKVLRFFTWTNSEILRLSAAIGCLVVSSWVTYFGIAVAMKNAERDWVLLITTGIAVGLTAVAALFVRSALMRDRRLRQLHAEVTKAKDFDFARLLVRSFRKTETGLDELLDIGQLGLPSFDPEAASPEDKGLLRTLTQKSVFLFCRNENKAAIRFILVGNKLVVEYSALSISILHLTRNALFIYYASADLQSGDITLENLERVPLSDVAEITLQTTKQRIHRSANDALFREYEKVIRNNLSNEIVSREYFIHVRKRDGQDLILPAGYPHYYSGRQRTFDNDAEHGERFARAVQAISMRIDEARAAVEP